MMTSKDSGIVWSLQLRKKHFRQSLLFSPLLYLFKPLFERTVQIRQESMGQIERNGISHEIKPRPIERFLTITVEYRYAA